MNQKTVLSPKERQQRLANIGSLLNEVLKRGEEKFALAKSTYDTVDRHCTKLDMDLQKYEDEQLIGPTMGRPSTGTSTAGSDKRPEKEEHSMLIVDGIVYMMLNIIFIRTQETKTNAWKEKRNCI